MYVWHAAPGTQELKTCVTCHEQLGGGLWWFGTARLMTQELAHSVQKQKRTGVGWVRIAHDTHGEREGSLD